MSKYLVIIEAPGKVKKFQSILGKDYKVLSTKGHFKDLPEKKLGINIKKDFEPTYEIDSSKENLVKNIIDEAKKSEIVYLFTDGDREGEYISYHVAETLPGNIKCKRAVSFSITKDAIKKAINDSGDINYNLVNAAEARRILDRLVGYKCSFPVKQATGGVSAGRTQSTGLRVLAEREKEIQDFIPVIYWPIEAELLTENKEKILAIIKDPKPLDISSKEEADKIISVLKKGPIKVSKYDVKNVNISPYAPFTTSTLQQAASSILGFSPKKTMSAAQNLYSNGLCTYHRTDSTNIVPEFIDSIRSYISSNFDNKYLEKTANTFSNKSKNAQEAHEACRVTEVGTLQATGLGMDEAKLYKLIWKRTVASQMSKAQYERRSAEFSCDKYILSASGSKELFDGFKKVWDYNTSDDKYLPDLKIGDIVDGIDFKTEKKETKPPSRYSEASFIKELEKRGIGRPSTFASIPATLLARDYIEINNKSIHVKELGMTVCDFMKKVNFCFIDYNFTSEMESYLDDISNGKYDKVKLLSEYWERLKEDIENAKNIKKENSKTGFTCPQCGGELLKKHSKFGSFYGCENFSNKENKCDYTAKIGEDGSPIEKEKKEIKYSDYDCPKCEKKMVEREGKYGTFYGCQQYPKCQGMRDKDGNPVESKKKKWAKKKKKSSKKKKKS